MKKYLKPELEITVFDDVDIIVMSGGNSENESEEEVLVKEPGTVDGDKEQHGSTEEENDAETPSAGTNESVLQNDTDETQGGSSAAETPETLDETDVTQDGNSVETVPETPMPEAQIPEPYTEPEPIVSDVMAIDMPSVDE